MNQFNNGNLIRLLRELPVAPARAKFLHKQGAIDHDDPGPLVTPLRELALEVDDIGLMEVAESIRDAAERHMDATQAASYPATIAALQSIIERQMKSVCFFAVPASRASWLTQTADALLGNLYKEHYPVASLNNDIGEALKSYAFGQGTACAFHLMRAYEAPIRSLAKALGYDATAPDGWTWGKLATFCEGKVAVHTDPDFVRAACRQFKLVAHEWRNDTMHCVRTYTLEEALGLLIAIPRMVRLIAERVKEDGTFV